MESKERYKLLLGVTGSVGLVGIHDYLIALREELASEIKIIMTASASRIVPLEVIGMLSSGEVFLDSFDSTSTIRVPHIQLVDWADLFVVLPATANCLAKTANGICDDLLSTAIIASPKPVAFFPNMHARMYMNSATQRNVERVTADGHLVVPPLFTSGFSVGTGKRTRGSSMPSPSRVVQELGNWMHGAGAINLPHASEGQEGR